MKQDYEKMRIAIKYWLLGKGYYMAVEAMDFASTFHVGTRKDGQPEFSHQVSQANLARTLICEMEYPEETIAVIFLHDVMEDYGVPYSELVSKFGLLVADAVEKMSKEFRGVKIPTNIYYDNMSKCKISSIAKGIDRLHNLMTMIGGFKLAKRISYIDETMDYVVPMLKVARKLYPRQDGVYENLKFTMTNQVVLYRALNDLESKASK